MKVLRVRDVIAMTGLARSTIYKYVKDGMFPRQIKLGCRTVGWLQFEIEQWLRIKAAQR